MFQSTPSGGKATIRHLQRFRHLEVSIHAFRGEGDPSLAPLVHRAAVSIHAFRGEGDNRAPNARACSRLFQSTPSGGKATARRCAVAQREWFQSTPSGGKATSQASFQSETRPVSIHAFRGEGDFRADDRSRFLLCFNPRLPGGRRPALPGALPGVGQVSIHAFRGEGDLRPLVVAIIILRFNPRLPGGRRPPPERPISPVRAFQSTPSGGKATARVSAFGGLKPVSIHAFRGEGDRTSVRTAVRRWRFNPRLPGGRRPMVVDSQRWRGPVSIHAFRGEGDPEPDTRTTPQPSFQSTPSGGKAT